jgi:hypothetical protein
MRRPRNLREALARALVLFPFVTGTGCILGQGGPCGDPTKAVIVSGTIGTLPDGGNDCSVCSVSFDFVEGCRAMTVNGEPAVECHVQQFCGGTGRRPTTLLPGFGQRSIHPVGELFAELARLEAASVPAFRVLARELREHRAPARLVNAAMRFAQDEIRHARSMSALAHRYGAVPYRPAFGPNPRERSLEAIATENAVEGCVRETYGALLALWQAHQSQDPIVAAAMKPIADDESRHAALAWEVAAWAEPRMTRPARRRVEEAREQALVELASESSRPVPPALVSLGGLPPPDAAEALLASLSA